MNWSIEDPKPRLEKKRVAGLVLAGKKPVLEGEGIEGQCSCEGTLLHRGNPAGKAYDKPRGGPELSGEEGRLLLLPERWRRVTSPIPFLILEREPRKPDLRRRSRA
jgi:hypothetical protein